MNSRNRSAFTLLEILVVMAVIGVLAGLAIPVYQRMVEQGRATACVSNLRQLGMALNLYLGEHQQIMPVLQAARERRDQDVPVIDNTLDRYITEPKAFACPSDDHWAEVSGTSYHWNNALNGQPASNLNLFGNVIAPRTFPVMADKGQRKDGSPVHPYLESKINILYADGHVTKEANFFQSR